jgi:hypothetical protein
MMCRTATARPCCLPQPLNDHGVVYLRRFANSIQELKWQPMPLMLAPTLVAAVFSRPFGTSVHYQALFSARQPDLQVGLSTRSRPARAHQPQSQPTPPSPIPDRPFYESGSVSAPSNPALLIILSSAIDVLETSRLFSCVVSLACYFFWITSSAVRRRLI